MTKNKINLLLITASILALAACSPEGHTDGSRSAERRSVDGATEAQTGHDDHDDHTEAEGHGEDDHGDDEHVDDNDDGEDASRAHSEGEDDHGDGDHGDEDGHGEED